MAHLFAVALLALSHMSRPAGRLLGVVMLVGLMGSPPAIADGDPPLIYVSGAGAGDQPEVGHVYRHDVEVAAGQRSLEIEIYDADVLMGVRTGAPDPDRLRGDGGSDSKIRYKLYDPRGRRVATRFVTADEDGPPGSNRDWVLFFSSRTASGGSAGRFADSFDVPSYTNDDGDSAFAGGWLESADLGGSGPERGDVRIAGGRLRLSNRSDQEPWPNQPSVERQLDLSGFAAARLSFDYATGPGVDFEDSLSVEASSDGGSSWAVLEELIGIVGAESGSRAYDLSGELAAATRIRFRVSSFYAGPDEFFAVDNLEVAAGAAGGDPEPGRWVLVADMSASLNRAGGYGADENGDDLNAFALRVEPPPSAGIGEEPAAAAAELAAPEPALPAPASPEPDAAIPAALVPAAAGELPAPAPDYLVGAGDGLRIEVFEDSSLRGDFTVTAGGSLVFPLLGEVTVSGLTASQIQKLLAELLEKDYLYDPHVSVTVTSYRSQKVQIQGMVRMPGIYYLQGPTRLFDLLSRAQGLLQAPGEIRAGQVARIVRSPSGETVNVDLHGLLVLGKDELNVALRDGDVVYVLRTEEVHVIGEVKRPGSYPYEEGMTVLKALSLAGGATKKGAVKHAVVRRIEDGKEIQIEVSMEDLLLGDDILEIPLSFW